MPRTPRGSAPTRTCIGCRRRAPKPDLVRIARRDDGSIVIDRAGRTPGRGAYVCSGRACFDLAARRGRLERALRAQEVRAADVERLKRELV